MLDHAIESAVKVPEPERRCIDLLVCTRQSFVVVNVISPTARRSLPTPVPPTTPSK